MNSQIVNKKLKTIYLKPVNYFEIKKFIRKMKIKMGESIILAQ